ncbi:hypothetical protein TCAL_17258 [Tigriopus californicus]|uniref:Uncharacterized protein n=1 Tax=Tigriopus californicus TaxID=6832 RepID=A0A553NZQ3_TIGCA|nr:hypothetical protein TCAL_17258 [Tigriopus californicus]
MAYCYRLKMRIPHPMKRGSSKTLQIKIPVPFKCRRFSGGRFGYSTLEPDTKFLERALQIFRHRSYSAF